VWGCYGLRDVTVRTRCEWSCTDPLYMAYHDSEWGQPLYDDQRLFEFLVLEGAQAGLSWLTVLKKRAHYRTVFDDFDPHRVARYTARRMARLLQDPGIIRNRLKIASAITNAKAFLRVQAELGSFQQYIWGFVGHTPQRNQWRTLADIPASTPVAATMSQDLKRRGFTFVGPTICYAFMQATGMVNDHLTHCFRYHEVYTRTRRIRPSGRGPVGPRRLRRQRTGCGVASP
jgi:DNA-3-methyladenine glycosylase I